MRHAKSGPPFQGWHPANFFFPSPRFMKGLMSAHMYTLTYTHTHAHVHTHTCTYIYGHLITIFHCNFQTEQLLSVFLVP